MEKKYTEEDMKNAIEAFCNHIESGFGYPLVSNWYSMLEEWLPDYISPKTVEEETIPITLGHIRAKCGWSDFCDVTGKNHYMLNEFSVSDREIFDVKISHAKELSLI